MRSEVAPPPLEGSRFLLNPTFARMNRPTLHGLCIQASQPLLSPATLAGEERLDDASARFVVRSRQTTEEIIQGRDDRLLLVVGPCSIHDPAAAREYARLLHDAATRYASELFLVMRTYVEKPRSILGWKGLLTDPALDGSNRVNEGLRLARKLMVDLAGLRVPVATEFLDPMLAPYLADLVTWGAIGARTTESQVHRALASGLGLPVGFKNRTDGDVRVAVEALVVARHPHWFASLNGEGVPAMLNSTGNPCCHLVLRGGSHGPNYGAEHVRAAVAALHAAGLSPRLMVDCSHGNSRRDPSRQSLVAADVGAQIAAGTRAICGLMLESNLTAGAQELRTRPLAYGCSVTDPCLAWDQTLPLLGQLAAAVQARRMHGHRLSIAVGDPIVARPPALAGTGAAA